MFCRNILFERSPHLGKVWRAATLKDTENMDELNLPDVCDSLHRCLEGIADRPLRITLATASTLVNGAARLYNAQIDSLFEDCLNLDLEMATKKTGTMALNSDSSDEYSGYIMSTGSQDSSKSIKKRRNKSSNSFQNKKGRSSNSTRPYRDEGTIENTTNLNSTTDENLIETTHESENTPLPNITLLAKRSSNDNNAAFDDSRPFGLLFIYDNCNDKLPSKIVGSSYDADV